MNNNACLKQNYNKNKNAKIKKIKNKPANLIEKNKKSLKNKMAKN